MGREYRIDIDVLKGISIIAVVLYHVGVLPYGYLGVDTFLVINGFLIITNLINFISNNTYSFFDWFVKRIFRFLPIITMAFLVCLIIGYFTMIPDDYENLSQSIVASGLASAEDVDTAISCGMAMRFPVWGPLTHLDAIGLDLGLAVQDSVLPSISCEQKANMYIRDLVARGETGAKVGKGFYDWSQRDIETAMKNRDAFIIEAVKARAKLHGEV